MLLLAPLLLASGTDFATRLWQDLPAEKGNVVISPASIETCLGLLIPATGISSKPALAQTLGTTTEGLEEFQSGLQKRMQSLKSSPEVTLANAGFFADPPRPTYVAAIADGYGATAEKFGPDATGQVNGWVNRNTKGRIPKLFDQLDARTHAVLVNAVTFDGDWVLPFSAKGTEKAPFTSASGTRSVDLMHLTAGLTYAEGSGFRMVQLPYKGNHYRMSILLPDAGDPAAVFQTNAWRSLAPAPRSVDLHLPKFAVQCKPDIETSLKKMGLDPLFKRIDLRPALANGGMDSIDQIVHRTYIRVDEAGTEAAASTGIVMFRGGKPASPLDFRVDRPFAFAIQRVETGEVLFEGVIREP